MLPPPVSSRIGLEAHCQRVAAYCREIAVSMKLPARSRILLDAAAKSHHDRPFSADAVEGMLRDCLEPDSASSATPYRTCPTSLPSPLATILEMANQFDEEIEFAPYSDEPLADLLARGTSPAMSCVSPHLRKCCREELIALVPRLPVCPARAFEVMGIMSRGDVGFDDLVSVASGDQVLAGSVLQVANSPAFARSVPARDVHQAVMYIGTEQASRVIVAAALKPVLSIQGGDALWQHSIDSAIVAELLAQRTSHIDPREAYVLGLLHDVGKLLLNIAPAPARECRERLTTAGVPRQIAEIVTCGADHALAGADVLRSWGLPQDYIAAVESHHQPERSPSDASALLYLVEFCTDSEEDLPSEIRMRCALDRVGLPLAEVSATRIDPKNTAVAQVDRTQMRRETGC